MDYKKSTTEVVNEMDFATEQAIALGWLAWTDKRKGYIKMTERGWNVAETIGLSRSDNPAYVMVRLAKRALKMSIRAEECP